MGFTATLLFGVGAVAVGFLLAWLRGRSLGRAAARDRDRALAAEAAANRLTRVWAADLRGATMTLQGHAEVCALRCAEAPVQAGLVAALRELVTLTDDLQDQIAPNAASHGLCPEPVPLEPAVRDAIAAVATALAPAQRRWRLAPGLAGYTLDADRRALSQVLQRVLGNAARHSRAGDWIEIGLESGADGLALVVEDEGTGLCAPDRLAPPGQPESRGLGLGLALARRLMEAHGGSLAMQAVARVGTRVVLRFPADRVVAAVAAG
ncbi:MAG: sensor histidine kinase [Acetobacteraceae bacterium]|jgi:signal transduction histidine kinase